LTQHRGGGCAERDHHILDDRRRAAARGVRASNLNGSLYGCKARRTDGDVIRAGGSKDRTSGAARKARLHWTADVDGGGQTATAGDGRRDGERDRDGLGTRQRKTLGAAARNERQQEYQRLNDSHGHRVKVVVNHCPLLYRRDAALVTSGRLTNPRQETVAT